MLIYGKLVVCCISTTMCVFLGAYVCFAGGKPKLKRGMTLNQTRIAVMAAGWMLPKHNSNVFYSGGKAKG